MSGKEDEEFTQAEFKVPGFESLKLSGVTLRRRSFVDRLLGREGEEEVLEQAELFGEPAQDEEPAAPIDPVPEGTPLSFEPGERGFRVASVKTQLERQRKEERKLEREAKKLAKEEERKRKRAAWDEAGGTPFERASAYDQAEREISDQIGRHRLRTTTGAEQIKDVGRHTTRNSTVGEPGGLLVRHERPSLPPLPELDAKAWAIRRQQQSEAEEWVEERLREERGEGTSAVEDGEASIPPASGVDPHLSVYPGKEEETDWERWGLMLKRIRGLLGKK